MGARPAEAAGRPSARSSCWRSSPWRWPRRSSPPTDYREQNRAELLQPPSAAHLFGTDNLGRDIFSRVLYGAQTTLYVSLVAVGLGTTLGSVVGLVSGYAGGRTDLYAQRAAWTC